MMLMHSTCNHSAHVVSAVVPQFPASVRTLHLGARTVLVNVSLDAHGRVQRVAIRHSSGNAALDAAGLKAARTSKYASAAKNCKPIAGTYIFRATFDPGH